MKNMIRSFIGLDSGTRERTITALVTAVIDFLAVFGIVRFTDAQQQALLKLILVVVTAFVWGYCSHYKNNCNSELNCKYTGLMRAEKKPYEEESALGFSKDEEVTEND